MVDVLLAQADTKMALRCIEGAIKSLEGAPTRDYEVSKLLLEQSLSLLVKKAELDVVVGKLEEYL